jgi:hypothetical protein
MSRLRDSVVLLALSLACSAVVAAAGAAEFVADSKGIYRVDARGQPTIVVRAKSSEVFVDATFKISPNESWAMIDYVPSRPGQGRIAEVKVLISLRTNERLDPEQFQSKYGVWLGELSEWDPKAPATVVTDDGKRVSLQ